MANVVGYQAVALGYSTNTIQKVCSFLSYCLSRTKSENNGPRQNKTKGRAIGSSPVASSGEPQSKEGLRRNWEGISRPRRASEDLEQRKPGGYRKKLGGPRRELGGTYYFELWVGTR